MSGWRGGARLLALGRLKTGEMNKLETAYAQHLELLKRAGEVLYYKFEGIKLRLADNTFLTVDFAVMASDGVLEMHECKGFMMDDSAVKIKVAAGMYPFRFKIIRKQPKRDGGGFTVKDVDDGL